jgi:flagellar hook assembly protein FlgD
VTLTMTAPDGSTPVSQAADQQPGTYPISFPPGGAVPTEGTWKVAVAATDDLGRQTQMQRTFTVDDTLGFLTTSVPRLFLPPGGRDLTISWKQTRATRAVVTIETQAGTVVRTLARRRYDAGDQSVTWNGLDRSRKRVKGGVYRAHVIATGDLGTSELVRTFTVRQIAAPKS